MIEDLRLDHAVYVKFEKVFQRALCSYARLDSFESMDVPTLREFMTDDMEVLNDTFFWRYFYSNLLLSFHGCDSVINP